MTRRFGTISVSIWDDPDFRALGGEAQRVYLMLTTQSSITSVGTIAVTLRRWAGYTSGSDTEGLSMALQELIDALFVVVDWDREELLVRSFVRWDLGYTNRKRLLAIQSTAMGVGSPLLAGVLACELDRLEVSHQVTASPIDVRSKGYRRGIEGGSIHAGSGYVSSNIPDPDPEPKTPAPADADADDDEDEPPKGFEYPPLFERFWSVYPRKKGKGAALRAWRSAVKRVGTAKIQAGVERLAADPNLPDPQFVPHGATWLNANGWDDDPFEPRAVNGRATNGHLYGLPGERKSIY